MRRLPGRVRLRRDSRRSCHGGRLRQIVFYRDRQTDSEDDGGNYPRRNLHIILLFARECADHRECASNLMDFPSSPLLGSSGTAIVINLFESAIYEELHISSELARAALGQRSNRSAGAKDPVRPSVKVHAAI